MLLFQVCGLKYGAKYNYRVFAENAAGISEPSNIIGPLLADDPHGETNFDLFFVSAPVKCIDLARTNKQPKEKVLSFD